MHLGSQIVQVSATQILNLCTSNSLLRTNAVTTNVSAFWSIVWPIITISIPYLWWGFRFAFRISGTFNEKLFARRPLWRNPRIFHNNKYLYFNLGFRLYITCRVSSRRSNLRFPPPLKSHTNTHAQHIGLPSKKNAATQAPPTRQDGSLDNTTPQKQIHAP